jgi:hypothetical protein
MLLISDFVYSQKSTDSEIYKAILKFYNKDNLNKSVVIDTTMSNLLDGNGSFYFMIKAPNDIIYCSIDTDKVQNLIFDFKNKLKMKRDLKPLIANNSDIEFVTEKQIDDFINNDNIDSSWVAYYRKFSKVYGFFRFTIVHYNDDNSYAILCSENHCGGLCGEGVIWVLKYIDNKWKICFRREMWVS